MEEGPGARRTEITVGSFNLHAGVDGWGRGFDVVAAARAVDADVLVLQEVWAPFGGTSQAAELADALGCALVWHPMAEGRRAPPHAQAGGGWMRAGDYRPGANALYIDSERPLSRRVRRSARYRQSEEGAWGLAALSRVPITGSEVVELGRLPRDRTARAVVVLRLDVGSAGLLVCGTHMSHLTSGSPLQFRRLATEIERRAGDTPAVLAGDMNLWGPPLRALLPGWRRVVRGRTWPSWRPHSQLDHVLVRGDVAVQAAEVLPAMGSDHLAVRARLAVA